MSGFMSGGMMKGTPMASYIRFRFQTISTPSSLAPIHSALFGEVKAKQ
jgi:hypothetical protein